MSGETRREHISMYVLHGKVVVGCFPMRVEELEKRGSCSEVCRTMFGKLAENYKRVHFHFVVGCFGCDWRNLKKEVPAVTLVVQCF